MKTLGLVVVWLALAVPSLAWANAQALQAQLAADEAASDPVWLNLLQYETSGATARSDILPGDFFLAEDGHLNPEAELMALAEELYAPVGADPDAHAICRFPARLLFLADRYDLEDVPEVTCPAFQAWSNNGNITGATLIFASGSLGDPATFYGHILLKFTSNASFSGQAGEDISEGSLLDASLNYGAIFPDNENPVVYVIKGLLGGYSSTYTSVEYYAQRGNYLDSQDRDLWEYRLNLTQDQVDLLVASSWELFQQENLYYYLTENCAYRFAELIALVTGNDLDFQGKPWSLPIDIFVDLAALTGTDGDPLIAGIERVMAPTTRFRSAYAALSPAQQSALALMVQNALAPRDAQIPVPFLEDAEVTDTAQAEVVETALLYIAMLRAQAEDTDQESDIRRMERAFLLRRVQLPAGDTEIGQDAQVPPPHEGHRSSTLQATLLSNSRLGFGLELRLRPVLTDFLTLPTGGAPFAELSMGDVSLLLRDESLSLQRLDLLRITALAPSVSDLPFTYRPSWRLRVGAESASLSRDGNVEGFFEGGIGHSVAPTAGSVVFGMVEGRASTAGDPLEAGVGFGAAATLGRQVQVAASLQALAPLIDPDDPTLRSDITLRLGDWEDRDVRFLWRYEDGPAFGATSELGLTFSWHF